MSEDPKSSRLLFICAGEQSGDIHGSGLMKALKNRCGNTHLTFTGLGGDLMKSEGLNALYHIKDLATVGFTDVIKKYSFFKKAISDCAEYVRENNPDAVILIDYPGFNLRLAEELKKFYTNKIIYYISPQLWAWHEKRVYKIKKYIDKMLVVFPFEVEFYKKFGVEAEYVGHPLTAKIKTFMDENPKAENVSGKRKITILPGSRKDEIKHHMPVLIDAVKHLGDKIDIEVKISKSQNLPDTLFDEYKNNTGIILTNENVYSLIQDADLVLTKAGTSTMECSLIGTPYLIFYKTYPLNYYILKPIVKIDNLGIANILSGKNIVREFIQKDFTAENLAEESLKILTDNVYRSEMIKNLENIRNILGTQDASYNAAKIIKETALA